MTKVVTEIQDKTDFYMAFNFIQSENGMLSHPVSTIVDLRISLI